MRPYTPEPISSVGSVDDLLSYLRRELEAISAAMELGHAQKIETYHVEPTKRFDGLTVIADGTDWNPGSGQGVYTYYNSSWHKLG